MARSRNAPSTRDGTHLTVLGLAVIALILLGAGISLWSWWGGSRIWAAPGGLAAGLLAGLLLARWWAPHDLAGIELRWSLPRSVQAHEPFGCAIELAAAQQRPPLSIEHQTPGERRPRQLGGLPGLGPQPTRLAWSMTCTRRGRTRLAPPRASTSHPFGLWCARRAIGAEVELLVLPYIGLLHRDLLIRLQQLNEECWQNEEAGDEEIAHLRPYRPGDPRHSIHWKASARLRSLVTITRHSQQGRDLAIVLDCAVARRPSPRLERVVAAAATVVDQLARKGWSLTLHGAFAPAAGISGARERLLAALACIEPVPGSQVVESIPADGPCLVFSLEPRELPPRRQRAVQIAQGDLDPVIHLRSRLC